MTRLTELHDSQPRSPRASAAYSYFLRLKSRFTLPSLTDLAKLAKFESTSRHSRPCETTQAQTISPAITKAESEMLGNQIQGIQREMVVIREQNASNPQVVEQVKGIETKLVQAASTQKMLHGACCKDSPNGKVCGEMCGKITSTLDQIEKDHAVLLKTMGHEHAAMVHQNASVDHDHAKSDTVAPATTK